MFNIGGGELLVIFLVALVILGPAKMPEVARQVGKWMGEFRKLSNGFQTEVRQAMNDPVTHAVKKAEAAEPNKPNVLASASTLDDGSDQVADPGKKADLGQIDDDDADANGDAEVVPKSAAPVERTKIPPIAPMSASAPAPSDIERIGDPSPIEPLPGNEPPAVETAENAVPSESSTPPQDPPMFGDR